MFFICNDVWYLNNVSIEFKIVCISHYHCVKIFKIFMIFEMFATAHTLRHPTHPTLRLLKLALKSTRKQKKNRATKPHIAYSTTSQQAIAELPNCSTRSHRPDRRTRTSPPTGAARGSARTRSAPGGRTRTDRASGSSTPAASESSRPCP